MLHQQESLDFEPRDHELVQPEEKGIRALPRLEVGTETNPRLTHYLKDILKGNSAVHVIGTVNQEDSFIMETLNTLNFISKAKKIDINPKMNFQTKSESANKKYIADLLDKIDKLEQENEKLTRENGELKQNEGNASKGNLEKVRKENKKLVEQVTQMREKMQKMAKKLEENKKSLKLFKEKEKKRETSDLESLRIESALNYLQPKFKAKRRKINKHASLAKKIEKIPKHDKRNKSTNLGKF